MPTIRVIHAIKPDLSCAVAVDLGHCGQDKPIMCTLAWHVCFALVRNKIRLAAINSVIGREMLDAQVTCSSLHALQVQRHHANSKNGFYLPHARPG